MPILTGMTLIKTYFSSVIYNQSQNIVAQILFSLKNMFTATLIFPIQC